MTPVADGRLHEGLVRIGGRGLELGAADDDAVIRLANDVEEHVRVLLLRALRPVPFGVGVAGDVKGIERCRAVDVRADVLGEGRLDLRQDVLAVVKRPHLPNGLVTHAGDDTADVVEHGVHGTAFRLPVLL